MKQDIKLIIFLAIKQRNQSIILVLDKPRSWHIIKYNTAILLKKWFQDLTQLRGKRIHILLQGISFELTHYFRTKLCY